MAVLATMQVLIAKLLKGSLKRNVTHTNEKKKSAKHVVLHNIYAEAKSKL